MYKTVLFLCLFLTLMFTSCDKDPASPDPDNPEIVTGTVIIADSLSGVLRIDNSPYIIRKKVTVPKDSTLIIKPGVEIYFKSSEDEEDFNYDNLHVGMLEVNGYIQAEGKIDSTITFSRANEKGYWGIVLIQSNDSNKANSFNFCNFEYGNKADGIQIEETKFGTILINNSKIEIKDCSIDRSRTDGISCYNSIALINNNKIVNSFDDGISCVNTKSEIINNRILSAINVAIVLDECIDVNIVGNVILGCNDYYSDFGIFLYKSFPTIAKNSIMRFSTGIRLYQSEYGSYAEPYKLLITDNNVTGNYNAICLESDAKVISEICNNSITNNKGTGIYTDACYNTIIKIHHNTIDNNAEGLYIQNTHSLVIDNNLVTNNDKFGIYCIYCNHVDITSNNIYMNGYSDSSDFPGLYVYYSECDVLNNLIAYNGIGVGLYASKMKLINCDIIYNKVGLFLSNIDNNLEIKNSIIHNNNLLFELADYYSGTVDISYCLVQDSILAPELTDLGNNIIASDPLFIDAINNNYQLSSGSPCRDKGTNTLDSIPDLDLLGNPRIVGTSIDIGAYEYQGSGK